jgi:hypothetical protein
MLEPKAGFAVHTISREDDEGWHSFTRKDVKKGKEISYLSQEPLQVYVPVNADTQARLASSYSTKIGDETLTGIQAVVARGALHELESLFGSLKNNLPNDGTLDDPEAIQEVCAGWEAWQGSGRAAPKVSRSKLEELKDDPEALMAYLATVTKMTD